ncbi:MAG TPA: sulfatase-like hydrolase/transferase [Phycisphaerae bacterium]|nr:sulfatase-like hydrolase/transferase [Phycisphaerae bacterium]
MMDSSTTRPRFGMILLSGLGLLVLGGIVYFTFGFGQRHTYPSATTDRLGLSPGGAKGFNLLVVTIDTLRADHLGCYGYQAAETPRIDALARSGALFLEASATVPLTLPSHSTIFTGLYPPRHGVRNNGEYVLDAKHVTLAERVKAAGYDTAGFISAYVLMARYGLDRGFNYYDDNLLAVSKKGLKNEVVDRPGNEVTDSFLKWYAPRQASKPASPFFAWLHYYDPHYPYEPPAPFDQRFKDRPYDGEIAFADHQLGRVLDMLTIAGELDRTLIVVVADHGESLGEHNEESHSHLIYDATMSVPMIFSNPKLFAQGQVVGAGAVSTADITPTVLSLLGLAVPGDLDGVDLAAAAPSFERTVYMESLAPKLMNGWSPLFAMRGHGEKYIRAPGEEYYDIAADPDELDNLFEEKVTESDRLSSNLTEYHKQWGADETPPHSLDAEQKSKLASLGYVDAGQTYNAGADPKDMMRVWTKYKAAKNHLVQGELDRAEGLLLQAIEESPDDPYGHRMLAQLYLKMKRMKDCRKHAERLVELVPDSTDARAVLATACLGAGDNPGFQKHLAIGLNLNPNDPELILVRGDAAAMAGAFDEAIRHFRRVKELDRAKYGDLADTKIVEARARLNRSGGSP